MSYKSPKSYAEAVLRNVDKHSDPSGLNPLTLIYAAVVQELNLLRAAQELQTEIALKTLEAIQKTKAEIDFTDGA